MKARQVHGRFTIFYNTRYVTIIRMDNQLQRAKSIFTDRWLVLERTPRPRPLWFYSDTAHTPIRLHRRLSSGLQGRSSSSSSVDVRMRWSASPRGSLWFRAPLESPFYVGAFPSSFRIYDIVYCTIYCICIFTLKLHITCIKSQNDFTLKAITIGTEIPGRVCRENPGTRLAD